MIRPNRILAVAYLSRGARLWLLIRIAATVVLVMAGADPLRLSGAVVTALIVLSVTVSFLDTYRHREHALLGNLAVSPLTLCILLTLPALAGELAIRFGVAALQ